MTFNRLVHQGLYPKRYMDKSAYIIRCFNPGQYNYETGKADNSCRQEAPLDSNCIAEQPGNGRTQEHSQPVYGLIESDRGSPSLSFNILYAQSHHKRGNNTPAKPADYLGDIQKRHCVNEWYYGAGGY